MRIYQSAPTERAFMRDKSWQTPWHREWVHGKIQPMDTSGGFIGYAVMLVVAALIGAMLAIGGAL